MAKVIGVSGAQGGGKSTLLKGLMAKGWHVDDFRVSRAVQAQLGWERLDRVMESPQTMMEFQGEVLRQKQHRDLHLAETLDGIVLTERTFADIAAYTSNWTFNFVSERRWDLAEAGTWLSQYLERCIFAQKKCYSGIVLLPLMDVVKWEEDPNRAARNTAERIYEDVRRFTEQVEFLRVPRLTITTETPEARVDQVDTFLRTLTWSNPSTHACTLASSSWCATSRPQGQARA